MKSLLGTLRRPDLIFRANGLFDITARVVRALHISPGDVVDVLSDGREYYLYVARHAANAPHARFEAQVFPSNRQGSGQHFRGSSTRLCKAILSICNANGRVALSCGEVTNDHLGRLLIPIITRQPLAGATN